MSSPFRLSLSVFDAGFARFSFKNGAQTFFVAVARQGSDLLERHGCFTQQLPHPDKLGSGDFFMKSTVEFRAETPFQLAP